MQRHRISSFQERQWRFTERWVSDGPVARSTSGRGAPDFRRRLPWLPTILQEGVPSPVFLSSELGPVGDSSMSWTLCRFFFGDGAGAAVLEATDGEPGFLGTAYAADGSFIEHWYVPAGGVARPADEDAVREGLTQQRFYKKYPPEIETEYAADLARRLAADVDLEVGTFDRFILTQTSRWVVERAMTCLGVPFTKAHLIMDKWGYTGAACLAMALHDAIDSGAVDSGDLIMLVGTGLGFMQTAVAVRL